MLDPNNTFFISDFHFDHINIIKYCNRPFKTVEEMNSVMLSNYNKVIKDSSTVYFVGDMSFGRGSHTAKWWLSQLRGKIVYIKGSHDHGIRPTNLNTCFNSTVLDTGIGKVFIVHEPLQAPSDWKDWVIHGHTHSPWLIDSFRKHVCVGVEATNYAPISLQRIREEISHA